MRSNRAWQSESVVAIARKGLIIAPLCQKVCLRAQFAFDDTARETQAEVRIKREPVLRHPPCRVVVRPAKQQGRFCLATGENYYSNAALAELAKQG